MNVYRRAVFSLSPAVYPVFPFWQIMQYVADFANEEARQMICNNYFADALMIISKSIAGLCGGSCISQRLITLLEPPEEDPRTEEEIIDDMKKKLSGMGCE